MMKVKTHHFVCIFLALLTVPLFASFWISYKILGDIYLFRPWLILTEYNSLPADSSSMALKAGFVGALAIGALLMYLFEGVIFGVKTTDSHGDARWSTRREAKTANLMQSWGVVLGKYGRPKSSAPILRTNEVDFSNILLSAPPRSGKGVGVIIPTLLEYPGSVIVYDVKGENYERTARMRKSLGDEVYVISPFDMDLEHTPEHGHELHRKSHSFNPLIEIKEMEDLEDRLIALRGVTDALLSVAGGSASLTSLLEDGRKILIAAMAVVCAQEHPSLGKVADLLTPKPGNDGETPDYKTRLTELAQLAPDQISKNNLLSAAGNDNKQIGIYLSVVESAGFGAWSNPAIIRASEKNDIDLTSLRNKPQSIYIAIPPQYRDAAAPFVRLLIQTAINRMRTYSQPKRKDGKVLPVLFMIDEFHTLGHMKAVVDGLTNLPGYGGRMCLVVQSPESLDEHYGKTGAAVMMDSIQLQLWMAPNAEETKMSLSKALGQKTIASASVSGKSMGSKDSGKSHSYSEKGRALMTPEELGRLEKTKLIIIPQNQRPILASKMVYYEDQHFSGVYASQENLPWPEIPNIKTRAATSYKSFLMGASDVVQAADGDSDEEEHGEVFVRTPAPDTGEGEEQTPAPTVDYSMFEDAPDENDAGLAKLDYLLATVKAPDYEDQLNAVLGMIPPDYSPDFSQLRMRLSAEDMIERLMPLVEAEKVAVRHRREA